MLINTNSSHWLFTVSDGFATQQHTTVGTSLFTSQQEFPTCRKVFLTAQSDTVEYSFPRISTIQAFPSFIYIFDVTNTWKIAITYLVQNSHTKHKEGTRWKNEQHMTPAPSPYWIHFWKVHSFAMAEDIENLNVRKQCLEMAFATIWEEAWTPSWDNKRGHVETPIKEKPVTCLTLFNKWIKFSGKKSEVTLDDLERKNNAFWELL